MWRMWSIKGAKVFSRYSLFIYLLYMYIFYYMYVFILHMFHKVYNEQYISEIELHKLWIYPPFRVYYPPLAHFGVCKSLTDVELQKGDSLHRMKRYLADQYVW